MQKEQSGKSTWIIFSRKNDLEIGVWQRFFNLRLLYSSIQAP